jgi:hypothetical protein
MVKFGKLKIGDKFVSEASVFIPGTGILALVAFEKKSLSSAYVLDSATMERPSCAAYWKKTYTRFSAAVEVFPLA